MKTLFLACLVTFSILLSPMFSTSFDAVAGRTQAGYGGEECACGMPAPPTCYDEATWQRCDGSRDSSMASSSWEDEGMTSDGPVDYTSGVLMLLVAAMLTSRAIRFP